MRFGLSEQTIEKICSVFAKHPAIDKAVLYGSRAKGTFRPGSDIDLSLHGSGISLRELGRIDTEIDDLLLPYSVDLLIFDALDHAKLRDHIERVGVIFYQRNGAGQYQGAPMKAGWQKKKLRDVCELINGRAYSKPELQTEGKYRVLRVGNFFTNDHWYHSDLELEEKKYCDTGDLLYAWSASFGPRIWEGEKVIYHYHIWKVLPTAELIDKKFLFMWFLWDTERIKEDQGTGTTMIHVSKGSMEDRDILVPPLPEQQRIVTILDQAFAGIATAKANAEKNLQNARALFDSYLQSVFSQRGAGWKEKPLAELCDIKHGFAFKSAFFSDSGDYVLLTPGNFYESGGYRDRGEKQKYYTGEIPHGFILNGGDLLVAMTEQAAGLLGSPLLVPKTAKFLHNQRLGLVMQKPGVPWVNEFFFYVFNTVHVRKSIHDNATGVKVRHTSPAKIGEVVVSYPTSISDQLAIVATLTKLSEATQHLESIYRQKLTALDELKKSILHQAFSGQL